MRKILVIAAREYLAAVRTKTFVISLLVMPIMVGASAGLPLLFKDFTDTQDRRFVIVDRTKHGELLPLILKDLAVYNEEKIRDPETNQQVKPKFDVDPQPPTGASKDEIAQQRYELSEQVRKGKLVGFLEILDGEGLGTPARYVLRYQTNRPLYRKFIEYVNASAAQSVREQTRRQAHLSEKDLHILLEPVAVRAAGLMRKDPWTEALFETPRHSEIAATVLPVALMVMMFSVVFMAAGPLLQSVVEEKMNRIAEVLLGSVGPFQLMMGKLLGMTGVSMTIEAVYLGCAYLAAWQWGVADIIPLDLIAWFVLFQALAALMYGSLFIAVGAVCTDMKDTQNLIWPVVLVATAPLFLLIAVLEEPNSPLATGLSFVPFATPTLMITRHAIPPGVPLWQLLVGVLLVLVTMLGCVWAAGRLFRIGLLLQGKPPRLWELFGWILRG